MKPELRNTLIRALRYLEDHVLCERDRCDYDGECRRCAEDSDMALTIRELKAALK